MKGRERLLAMKMQGKPNECEYAATTAMTTTMITPKRGDSEREKWWFRRWHVVGEVGSRECGGDDVRFVI